MRVVMMGTGPFAVPTLRALYDTPHTVAALVTQPIRTTHGKEIPNAMRQLAIDRGTPVLTPESVNTPEARHELAAYKPGVFVVADYGQILSAETLAVAPRGGVNLHGSLLPRYRGAAPINWAIWHGDTETGVTVIHMTPHVDAGPLIAMARTPIDPEETATQLETRLAQLGAPLVQHTLEALEAGRVEPLSQDSTQATPARRLRKTDGVVNWTRPAAAIKNQVRALEPWPKTYTYWHRTDGEAIRLILGHVRTCATPDRHSEPGFVLVANGCDLIISTGEAELAIDELQPAGKRLLTAAEFLRGYPVRPGDRFGPAAG